jgi:hypothetical protein
MISKAHLKNLQRIVALFDNQFNIGPFKFGIDPILGFIPILGDIIPTLFSVYMVMLAIVNKLPKSTIWAMIFFTVVDFIFGTVPVAGDIVDFFYKSHTKNYQLLIDGLKTKRA